MIQANGGFPPIKYCSTEEVQTKVKASKERLYAPKTNNINIRQILKDSKKKSIIDNESNKDKFDLDIV